ncbi:Gfo/Idh/MocA family oxidoreductase [Pseudonocardia sp. RS11V-5]|uniref:Gfo/Idh/MocA family protein n=1 Tax=Pseudonocardia terrae TaxID=2905831 RepID=UPI001E402166|nr:Gfo/Idh/MocA family oxidoreductase [Pseudonocardia terrae]MCE3552168.1 Gfo/Idh/MocA family oxidoreductase [Pseudonocardia terrae]
MTGLRIGLLGASRIADEALVRPSATTEDRLVAVAARDRARAEAFARRFGVERVVDDYAALLADPEVDVVYNALPNALHAPWNQRIVVAGKALFAEKPFAGTAAECREVRDAAAAGGVPVFVGYHYLHHPLYRRLAEVVASGEIGEVTAVETRMRMPAPPPDDVRWSLPLAGGALMDLGCYAVHTLLMATPWLGGAPSLTDARAGERTPGVDEWAEATYRYPGGAEGRIHCHIAAPGWEMAHQVTGTRGSVMAPMFPLPHRDDRLIVQVGTEERVERLGTTPTYDFQLAALREYVGGTAPLPRGAGADFSVEIAEQLDSIYLATGLPLRPSAAAVG